MFKVGFAGGLYYEGPVCSEDGRVKEWHSPSAEWRLVYSYIQNLYLFNSFKSKFCLKGV